MQFLFELVLQLIVLVGDLDVVGRFLVLDELLAVVRDFDNVADQEMMLIRSIVLDGESNNLLRERIDHF